MNYFRIIYRDFLANRFNWKSQKVIFIISSGRTGTNFMAHWFTSLGVEALHEPKPDLFDVVIEKHRKRKELKQIIRSYKRARILHFLKLEKSKQEIYIESNPNMLLLLPELNEIFEDLKIVFIVRDYRSYVMSAINKSPDGSGESFFYAENDTRLRVSASELNDQKWSSHWNSFSREEKIAWWWKRSFDIIDEYSAAKSNCIVIDFNDLFNKENSKLLEKILDFVGLQELFDKEINTKVFAVKKNTNVSKIIETYSELDHGKRMLMEKIAEI